MPVELDSRTADFEAAFETFLDAPRDEGGDVGESVAAIIAEVRERGDAALIDFTERFDGVRLEVADLRIPQSAFDAAEAACGEEVLEALSLAAERIADYHARQSPPDLRYEDDSGFTLGHRWTPVDAVGLYVPGGTAAYPSSVLMNALPAQVAGVRRRVMVTPAPGGEIAPLVLAAAKRAGVTEAYRIGGAQAVAALAYGTETIARVDKIVGPGNAYVAEAKRQVFGQVGIDSIAGPSEILVVADAGNDPRWIAADLLSQAEHDSAAQSILITDDRAFAAAVLAAVDDQLATLSRRDTAVASWRNHGAVILVSDIIAEAPALIDRVAPEHLELALADAEALAARVRHAGAIFLGAHATEALGDYLAGPNHVLPTSRTARFSSGLSVLDFVKRTSLIGASARALETTGRAAIALAEAEGLAAHARAVALRLEGDGREED